MRTVILTIFLLLIVGNGLAVEKQPDKTSVKGPDTNRGQKSSDKKTAEKKDTVQWPRPYKATEEVSADSMVPFPTDI